MLKFVNGQVVPLTVEENIQRAFIALTTQFPNISFSQFEGSREYELAYMLAQHAVNDAVLMTQTLNTVLNQAALDAEELLAANTLQFRFASAMKAYGYNVYAEHGAGTMRVSVSPIKESGATFDPSILADGGALADLLAREFVPNGTILETTPDALAVVSAGNATLYSQSYTPAGTTIDIPIEYIIAPEESKQREIHFDVQVTTYGGANVAVYESQIRKIIDDNWNGVSRLGREIVPQSILPSCSLPWAKSLIVRYQVTDAGGSTSTNWESLPSADASAQFPDYNPKYWEDFKLSTISVH